MVAIILHSVLALVSKLNASSNLKKMRSKLFICTLLSEHMRAQRVSGAIHQFFQVALLPQKALLVRISDFRICRLQYLKIASFFSGRSELSSEIKRAEVIQDCFQTCAGGWTLG